jgi:hypothetical protein
MSPRSSSPRRGPRSGPIAPLAGARSARIALLIPPTSSSLRDEKHVPSLLLTTAGAAIRSNCSARWRSLRADRAVDPAYFVVAPGRKACPLAPPHQGGARSGPRLAPESGVRNGTRLSPSRHKVHAWKKRALTTCSSQSLDSRGSSTRRTRRSSTSPLHAQLRQPPSRSTAATDQTLLPKSSVRSMSLSRCSAP